MLYEVTDAEIEALKTEAAQYGDQDQVNLCKRALRGNQVARRLCARAIGKGPIPSREEIEARITSRSHVILWNDERR